MTFIAFIAGAALAMFVVTLDEMRHDARMDALTDALALGGFDPDFDEFDQCRECTKCIGHEPGCSKA